MSTTAPAAPPPPPPPAFGKQPVKKFQPAEGPTDRDALMADIRNGPRLRSVAKPKEKKLFVSVECLFVCFFIAHSFLEVFYPRSAL